MVEIGLWLNPATVLAICVWNPPGRSTFQLCCRLMLAVPPFYFVALMVCAAVNNQRCVVNHEIKCIDSVSLFKGWCDGRHPLGVRNRRVLAVPMIAGKSIVLSRKDEITFHWVCRRGARENIQPFSCIVHHLSMTWADVVATAYRIACIPLPAWRAGRPPCIAALIGRWIGVDQRTGRAFDVRAHCDVLLRWWWRQVGCGADAHLHSALPAVEMPVIQRFHVSEEVQVQSCQVDSFICDAQTDLSFARGIDIV
jgi:hypothetical protein